MEEEKMNEKMKNEVKEIVEQITPILNNTKWETDVFVAALKLGHELISRQDEKWEAYERWQMHQELSLLLSELRAEALGEVAEVVFNFFPKGIANEISLFTGYMENEVFKIQVRHENDPIIIGYGCKDLSVTVWAKFDTSTSQDWGWKDGYGEHIEYFNADTQNYVRSSMSGRTNYCLKIQKDEGSLYPKAIPLENYNVERRL